MNSLSEARGSLPSVLLCGRTLWQRPERNLDLSLGFFQMESDRVQPK
jgi:hypothetical protein